MIGSMNRAIITVLATTARAATSRRIVIRTIIRTRMVSYHPDTDLDLDPGRFDLIWKPPYGIHNAEKTNAVMLMRLL